MKKTHHTHLTISYSSSLDRDKKVYYVGVWNDKSQKEIFHFKCHNEESAKMMVKALELNYKITH
jgi:IMP cyclohydrolase